LRVQLKGRCTFDKKYMSRELHVCFPIGGEWFLYPHDKLLRKVLAETAIGDTTSWKVHGGYSFPIISKKLRALLEPYRLMAKETHGLRST
jgi:hypothetical protein